LPEYETQTDEKVLGEWESILSGLERDLTLLQTNGADAATTARLAFPAGALPRVSGPIPAHLVARAQRVLDAQREALTHLQQALASTSRHIAAVRSVPQVSGRGASVYLDAVG